MAREEEGESGEAAGMRECGEGDGGTKKVKKTRTRVEARKI